MYQLHLCKGINHNNIVLFTFVGVEMFMCILFYFSMLWRTENALQQQLNAVREELSKKEQGLRSLTGKVHY